MIFEGQSFEDDKGLLEAFVRFGDVFLGYLFQIITFLYGYARKVGPTTLVVLLRPASRPQALAKFYRLPHN